MRTPASLIASAVLSLVACQSAPVASSPSVPTVCARDVQPPVPVAEEPREDGSDVVAPVVLRRVDPKVTRSVPSRATATVEAVIDEDGVPRNVCAVAGDPTWGGFLVAAVRQWRFRPGTLDGKPVSVIFRVTSTYSG